MPFITSEYDGARLHYRDYVPADSPAPFRPTADSASLRPTLLFSSAWPFSSHMWDHLILPFCESHRYRCIAPDRRGYGQSEWSGATANVSCNINYNVFAKDLLQVMDTAPGLSGSGFVGIGSSLGCGELLLALSESPKWREQCKGFVFIGSSLPIPLRTEQKPNGPPREFWDGLLDRLRDDNLGTLVGTLPFIFGEKVGNKLAESEMRRYMSIVETADPIAVERTVQAFLERDLTDVMGRMGREVNFPILILHGDGDEVNPIKEGPELVKRLMPTTEIKIYENGAHGLAQTHQGRCVEDILGFLKAVSST